MHLRCPHCQNPIELAGVPSVGEITCAGCGSTFNLDAPATASFDSNRGARLGRFELLDLLGEGAFGTVFKARDPELDRTVAIKIPRAGNVGRTRQELDRFLREARSVAQLRFPTIIAIHEVGQIPAEGSNPPTPYLVCDYVQGITLADHLTGRGFRFTESATLIAAVADALQYAHSLGVVHRDVKPSNIMIRPDGAPCVMDFGLAKRDAGEITMTIDGQILGTPAYMSPEQARGDAHKVDGRSDVYSLGVMLYQLLTGELPFRGNKAMLLHQVLQDEPKPPRGLNDKIPRDLETIALKAMAKEPGRRYGSAKELAEDLRRWLAGEPIRARRVGRVERSVMWCRKNPVIAMMSATLAAVIAIAFVVGVWQLRQTTVALVHADRQQEQRALAQVNALRDAASGAIPTILQDLEANRESILPHLRAQFTAEAERGKRMRLAMALLPVEPDKVRDDLAAWMLEASDPAEAMAVRDALKPHAPALNQKLWQRVDDPKTSRAERFRALAALATFDADNARWHSVTRSVVDELLTINPLHLGIWVDAFRPVRMALLPTLHDETRLNRLPEQERAVVTVLGDYASDQPSVLTELLLEADAKRFVVLFPNVQAHADRCLPILINEFEKAMQEKERREAQGAAPSKVVFAREGRITAKDLQVKGMPAKLFEVTLQAGKKYRFTMTSKEIDSFIIIQDVAGAELRFDDDSGGNFDSQIDLTALRTGTYKVFAAALQENIAKERQRTGAFAMTITENFPEDIASRLANAAIALLRLKQPERVWPLLEHAPDPSVCSWMIARLGPAGVDVSAIINRLDMEPDFGVRRALILSLGDFPASAWPIGEHKALVTKMQDTYRSVDDAGVHAAAEWLLRQWKQDDWLRQMNDAWAKGGDAAKSRLARIGQSLAKEGNKARPQWYVNGEGHTMVVVPGPVEFLMGSPPTEKMREADEIQHYRRINRSFAVAAKPVTVAQYKRFNKSQNVGILHAPTDDCPIVPISWLDAANYCIWLSKVEGIPRSQWCYEVDGHENVVSLRENYLSLTGYRLSTEAEWEYACRGGAVTPFFFGSSDKLLGDYAWRFENSGDRSWPSGMKRPNQWGLFDMHGNVYTWCQERYRPYPIRQNGVIHDDKEDLLAIDFATYRVLRGGSFTHLSTFVFRCADRGQTNKTLHDFGFRIARTYR